MKTSEIALSSLSKLLLVFFLSIFVATPTTAEPMLFTVNTAEKSIESASLQGSVVYVDFWASWCAPCRKSFPWMNAMQKKYGDQGFTIIAINLDKEQALAQKFLDETTGDFTIAYDPDANLAEKFNVTGMPSAFILDRTGEIVSKHTGFRSNKIDEYEKSISNALQGTK